MLAAIQAGKKLKGKDKQKKLKKKETPKKGGAMSLMDQMKERMARRANVMSGREDEESQKKQKKRRGSVLGKAVVVMAGSALRAKKRVSANATAVAAKPAGAGGELGSGSDSSNSSFSDSDDDGGGGVAAAAPVAKPKAVATKRPNKVIAKPRAPTDPENKSVGGFSTRGMKGLTALLAHKGANPKARTESFASVDDDWDSD